MPFVGPWHWEMSWDDAHTCSTTPRGLWRVPEYHSTSRCTGREWPSNWARLAVFGDWAESPYPPPPLPPTQLTDSNQSPHSTDGHLLAQSPLLVLWPLGCWNHTDPLRILPLSSHEPLSYRDVSHWSIFLTVLILSSGTTSLSGSQLLEAPSPLHLCSNISLQIHFSTPPALQKADTFLLLEFQIFFSVHLRLNSWMFRMVW